VLYIVHVTVLSLEGGGRFFQDTVYIVMLESAESEYPTN